MRRVVIVNDKMQQGYRYELSASVGRDFDPQFRPDLDPEQMLELGVFCGKYLIDCRDEYPASWFARAKLSPSGRDCSLNYFGVDASHTLVGVAKEGLDACGRSARLVPVVLPLLHRPAAARRGRPPDRALEGDEAPRVANHENIASRAIRCAGRASAKRSCTGPMTAGKFSRRSPDAVSDDGQDARSWRPEASV